MLYRRGKAGRRVITIVDYTFGVAHKAGGISCIHAHHFLCQTGPFQRFKLAIEYRDSISNNPRCFFDAMSPLELDIFFKRMFAMKVPKASWLAYSIL